MSRWEITITRRRTFTLEAATRAEAYTKAKATRPKVEVDETVTVTPLSPHNGEPHP